jgi:hypothetical protein
MSGLAAAAGLLLAILFNVGILAPISVLIVSLFLVAAWGLAFPRVSRTSLLPRFLILIYTLPFTVLIGYLFVPDYVWTWTPQGRAALNDILMRQLITVGLVGLIGLTVGTRVPRVFFTRYWRSRRFAPPSVEPKRALAFTPYAVLLLLALLFSYLSAPAETILDTPYGGEQLFTLAVAVNFPSAFIVSYVLLALLFVDFEREERRHRRRWKVLLLTVTVLYIVLNLQLLRGDRECSGLIAALIALYVTSQPVSAARNWVRAGRRRVRRAAIAVAIIVPVFIGIASARITLSDPSRPFQPIEALKVGWSTSPWTMTLLSNLAAAWLYQNGELAYRYGSTYRDYVLSLPPGILTRAIGIERPVETDTNLAAELVNSGLTGGGAHVVLTPFINFGTIGALIIMGVYGVLIACIDLEQQLRDSVRLLWASMFVVGFLWFWYGEMAGIRGVMCAAIAWLLYRVLLGFSRPPPLLHREREVVV